MIDKVTAQLRRDEGEVLHAYEDSEGFLTIGIGRLIDEKRGGGITRAEAAYLLANDLERVQAELDADWPWWRQLSEARQGVMLNMAFNLGRRKLAGFTRFLTAMRAGDWARAGVEMEDSTWWRQVGQRAVRLRQQLLEDRWV